MVELNVSDVDQGLRRRTKYLIELMHCVHKTGNETIVVNNYNKYNRICLMSVRRN